MADFRIWGRVECIGRSEFFVIASAVPVRVSDVRPIVLTLTAYSLQQATSDRDRLMVSAGEKVRARGDRVVDVET
jgi:hypothetical protein